MATRLSDIEVAPKTADVADVPVDKLLVLEFQTGNREAYAQIFERYRPLTERICFRILGNREDASEAVQETMLRVLRGLETFNGRYQLQAWIARIATNVSVDMLRAKSRRPNADVGLHIGDHDLSDPGVDPQEIVEQILESEAVLATLEGLPSHHREALLLREFEGRSHEEIGEALGVSPAQAKALIHRAKGTFRKAWSDGDRRGLAAIMPIILLPFRLPGLRRLVEPARDAVANVSTTATQVAVNVTAAPAAAQTAMSAADKVTAVALTVIVAGSATVGAVAIRHSAKPAAKPSPSVAVAAAPSIVPAVGALHAKTRPAPHHKVKHHTQTGAVSEPSPAPSTAPSAAPSDDPSGSPSPGGSPVPPLPVPAPAWSASFHSSVGVGTPQLALVDSNVIGGPGRDLTFAQTIQGDTVDQAGKPFGFMNIEYNGEVLQGVDSYLGLWIWVDTPDGRFAYQATGGLTGVTQASDGSTTYVFSATYAQTDAPDGLNPTTSHPMPLQGAATLTLTFWADGTLYASGLALAEAPTT